MQNEILIYGPIGMGFGVTAEEIVTQLEDAGGADVLVRINTKGGSYDEGPAIYNALSRYPGRVETSVEGVGYSMGALILQAGKTRSMASNAVIMVHGAQYAAEGSADDMRKTADMMDVHNDAMISAFTSRGIAESVVRGWLGDGIDHYFNASDAKGVGLIDKITDEIDMAAAVAQLPQNTILPPSLAAYQKAKEDKSMADDSNTENTENNSDGKIDTVAFMADRTKNIDEGKAAGKREERIRQNAISAFFDRPQFSDGERIGADNVHVFTDLRQKCLSDERVTVDAARNAALDLQDGLTPPILTAGTNSQIEGSSFGATLPSVKTGRASAGIDAKEKYIAGVTQALCVQAGIEKDKKVLEKARENEYLGMSAYEMARKYLDTNRIQIIGGRRAQIIGQALVTASGIAHSTSDFANILENVAEKAMLRGWDEAAETWQEWARTGTLSDFKQGSRVNLSSFGDLDVILENGEYKYGSFSDLKEVLQLATYGKLFGVSRAALASDDLSALSQIPRAMGRAAARKIGDLAYDVLISNPVLNQDATEVFHADHNNLGTGGAIDAAPGGTLDEAWTAMGLQTDPAGTVLNITPAHLVVPKALEISTTSTISDKTFADSSNAQERANPFQGRLTVTADARLDGSSETQWYALASGEMHDTVEVAFLNGQQTPYLESKEGWNVDGSEYKVRIDAVAAALDFRTMFRNAGA